MRTWRLLPIPDILPLWQNINHLVEMACETTNGKYSPDYFLSILLAGSAQLWMDQDNTSAVITDIIVFPYKKFARLTMAMGDPTNSESFITIFETWAKEQGCGGVLSEMRLGFSPPFKKAGWKQTHILMEKDF